MPVLRPALLTATAGLALAAVPAHAAVVDCDTAAVPGRTTITSARNMSCAAAAKVMKTYPGQIGRTFVARHYRCTRVSGSQYGGQWRCTKGPQAFRFDFKD